MTVPSVTSTTPAATVEPKASTANVPATTSFTDTLATAQAKQAERLQHVKGHQYAKVVGGERDGRYVNRSDNARAGQDFAIVRRDGRTFHVYGEGADRAVVEVRRPAAATPATPAVDATVAGGAAPAPAASAAPAKPKG